MSSVANPPKQTVRRAVLVLGRQGTRKTLSHIADGGKAKQPVRRRLVGPQDLPIGSLCAAVGAAHCGVLAGGPFASCHHGPLAKKTKYKIAPMEDK